VKNKAFSGNLKLEGTIELDMPGNFQEFIFGVYPRAKRANYCRDRYYFYETRANLNRDMNVEREHDRQSECERLQATERVTHYFLVNAGDRFVYVVPPAACPVASRPIDWQFRAIIPVVVIIRHGYVGSACATDDTHPIRRERLADFFYIHERCADLGLLDSRHHDRPARQAMRWNELEKQSDGIQDR